jgi:hypothetical protein
MEIEHFKIQEGARVWIFQANPKYYRILDALQALDEIVFRVTRYGGEIRKGDTVLFWISGKFAGIYAIGKVTDSVREMVSPEEDVVFWTSGDGAEITRPSVPIKIEKRFLANPLLKEKIAETPALGKLDIMRQFNATNFKVTTDQWVALRALLPKEETLDPVEEVKKWANKQAGGRKLYDETCGRILEHYVEKNFEPKKEYSRDKILAWFHQHYPLFDAKTVECHVMKYTTNYRSRVYYGAKQEHDLLFRVDDDWKRLRLYQPDEDPSPIYEIEGSKPGKGKIPRPTLSPIENHRRVLDHLLTYGEITPEEAERIGAQAEDIATWQDSLLVARPGTMVVSPLFLWASEGAPTSSGFATRLVIRMIGNQLDRVANNPIDGLEEYVWEHFGGWHLPQPHPGDEKWHGYLHIPIREAADFTASEKLDLFSHLPPLIISELLRDSGFQSEQQKWGAISAAKGSLGPLSQQMKFGERRPLFLSDFPLPEMQEQSTNLKNLPSSDVISRFHVISGLPLCTGEEWHQGAEVSIEDLQDRLLNHPLNAAIVQFEIHRLTANLSGEVSGTLCLHGDGNCRIDIPGRDDTLLWSACKKLLSEIGYWPVSHSGKDSQWESAVQVAIGNLEKLDVMELKGETFRLTESFESRIKAHPGHPQNRGEKDFRIRLLKFCDPQKT